MTQPCYFPTVSHSLVFSPGSSYDTFHLCSFQGVTPTASAGSLEWEQISGSLNVIEVSTDGKVFGVNADGDVYQRYVHSLNFNHRNTEHWEIITVGLTDGSDCCREGVLPCNPAGTGWRQIPYSQKVKHVSYDLGHLWLITRDNHIIDCTE